MKSRAAERIMAKVSPEDEIFIRLYADITVRINQILKERGMSQKDLAEAMCKKPSEINKWLKGDHNFTLRSLAKLMAELNEVFLYVPKQKVFIDGTHHKTTLIVHRNVQDFSGTQFKSFKLKSEPNSMSNAS